MFINSIKEPFKYKGITIYNVSPVRGGDSFLFIFEDGTSFIYDSGFGFSSDRLYENIKAVLGDRNLDYILLSHSHYDHALGSACLTVKYPEVKVVAFSYAAKILEKESARTVMRRLNKDAAVIHNVTEFNDYVDYLHADIKVEDNDILDMNGHKIQIISLPGHTKDCVAFYLMEEKLLLGTETLGMYVADGLVMPSFLVGYHMSLDSIDKVRKMVYSANGDRAIEAYFIPHWGLIEGDDVDTFLEESVKGHILGRDLIVNAHKEGKSHEEIFAIFQEMYYTPKVTEVYPFPAFVENTNIQIPMILREEGFIE